MDFNEIIRCVCIQKSEGNFGLARGAGKHKSKNVPRLDVNAENIPKIE